jgi:GNAT superfamily N-acetyltransferase
MWEYYTAVRSEDLPDDPVYPLRRQVLDWQAVRDDQAIDRWLLRDENGSIVAAAIAVRDLGQNLDNGFAKVHVREDMRKQGLGTILAEPILEMLYNDGRKRLATDATAGTVGEIWAEKLGMKMAIQEKRSRLRVGDIDRNQMQLWVEGASERAGDYELRFHQAPFPEEVIVQFCELLFQMNTAPLDDYEEDDLVVTPEIWRDWEAKANAAMTDINTFIAVHKPTGEFVGSTSIETDRLWSEQAWQWETVVHPDHRNKGLGRWLKAAMIEKLATMKVPVERIDTFNAGSNAPMLGINLQMGFKPILVTNTWQGDLAMAKELLTS